MGEGLDRDRRPNFGKREQAPGGWRKVISYSIGALSITGFMLLVTAECNSITNAAAVSAWADKMSPKLEDPSRKLTSEEKFYPKVEVVAAGETLEEQWRMQKEGTRVNVRYSPATEVIGTIAQGSVIFNVVLTTADSSLPKPWGVFRCSDGPVKLTNGGNPAPDTICTASADYLAAVK